MRKVSQIARLALVASFLAPAALFAQGLEVPPTPRDPGGIDGFLTALMEALRAFLEGLIGTVPLP